MKSVLTIAVGKEVYVNMAIALAQSFLLWNRDNGIKFILVTDRMDIVSKSPIYNAITVIEININDYDNGFAIKLHLDKFLKTEKTLFIDCDCLVYRDLSFVFERFNNHSFSVIGDTCVEGDFFGDIAQVIKKFNLSYLPKFVGAVYYIENENLVTDIFEFARSIKPKYDEIGLLRLRNKENEEPLIAIAMSKYNQIPMVDDGMIKADRMCFSLIKCNVLYGKCELVNKINQYPTWNKLDFSKPIIAHFNASYSEHFVYKTEVMRLFLFSIIKSKLIVNIISNIIEYYPGKIKEFSKKILRPIYHKIFGFRRVSESLR